MSYEGGVSTCPYDSLFKPLDSNFRDVIKAHPNNFKVLIYIIESFGRFKHNIPNVRHSPFLVELTTLRDTVIWLSINDEVSRQGREMFFRMDSLPGAVVDEGDWRLVNGEQIMPHGFTVTQLRDDFVSVVRLLENMKTKFEQVVDRVTFSGIGKSGVLMSIREPLVQVPFMSYQPEDVDEDTHPAGRGKCLRKSSKTFQHCAFG